MRPSRVGIGITVALVVGMGCGAAAGFWVGRKDFPVRGPVKDADLSASLSPPESAPRPDAVATGGGNDTSLPAATRVNIPAQFAELLKVDSWLTRSYKLDQLFATMSAEDAPAILTAILALPNAQDRARLLDPFFKQWGKKDGRAAAAQAQALVGREKRSAMSATMTGWAEVDPYAAWEVAKEQVPGASMYTVWQFTGVVTELAKRDLNAAFGAYAIADNRWSRAQIQHALMTAAIDTGQVPALVAMTHQVGDAQEKEEWIGNIFQRWGESDTGAPLESMRNISDPGLARKAMEGFLQGWMQADPAGAVDYAIANHGEPMVTDAVGPLLRSALYQGTREENYELVARIAEGGLLDKTAPRIVSAVAMSDPEFALHIASQVADPESRAAVSQSAIANWAANQFGAASAYVSQMPASDLKTKVIGTIAWAAMRREGGGAQIATWLRDVPAGKERTKVVEQLLATAASPHAELKPDFLTAIKPIALSESGLSEDAVKHRDKLFGAVSASPGP